MTARCPADHHSGWRLPLTEESRPNWITLNAASELLGVSESTIRRWADSGEVRSFRTAGGHRRVLEDDIRAIVSRSGGAPSTSDTDRITGLAMARVKRRMSRGRQTHSMDALEGMSTTSRERLRLTGRQMVDLFARYIASGAKGAKFAEHAKAIGREYGRTLVAERIGLTSAIVIFTNMRRSLEETASQIATEAGLSTEEAVEAVENTLELADRVLEGMAAVYEESLPR